MINDKNYFFPIPKSIECLYLTQTKYNPLIGNREGAFPLFPKEFSEACACQEVDKTARGHSHMEPIQGMMIHAHRT